MGQRKGEGVQGWSGEAVLTGELLTSDHGLLHYLISFDEEGNFVGIELLDEHGGHPAFTSGGEA